jgi:hypothetical protein
MSVEVATGDLHRAFALLNTREQEPVRLALPAGFGELTVWRGCWESAVWAVESDVDGPSATVPAEGLRSAADRPMLSVIASHPDGGLQVGDVVLDPAEPALEPPPGPSSLLGGADLALPMAGANPYAPALADIDQGASKVWLPSSVLQRIRLRQISRLRLFPHLGAWFVSGVKLDDSHLVRVVAKVLLA